MPPRKPRLSPTILGILLLSGSAGAFAPPVLAQQTAPASKDASIRLFQSFVQDGAVQPNVWLEGQWRMESNAPLFDGGNGTWNSLSGILALGFKDRFEAGLSWGGVSVDPDESSSHSGAGDIEAYGKYLLRNQELKIAVGGLVKIPTANSDEGLGSGSTDWEAFVALRRDYDKIQAVANAGFRQNGDPDVPDVSGEASFLAGGGVIFELGRRSFGSLELSYESRRYEGLSSDFRMTPGFLLGLGERGFFRAAWAIGLTDGAPDSEIIAGFGWAY
jgi:hypothetical protein